jgi:hypothetical protein
MKKYYDSYLIYLKGFFLPTLPAGQRFLYPGSKSEYEWTIANMDKLVGEQLQMDILGSGSVIKIDSKNS